MLWYYYVIIIVAVILLLAIWRRSIVGPNNSCRPSLDGKVVVITGGNAGIGYEAAIELAKLQPKALIIGCRNQARGEAALKSIKELSGCDKVFLHLLDLGDLESVKAFSETIIKEYEKVDILLNNGGLPGAPERTTTKQGFEQTIGVNHLGHFLLTLNLLPYIRKSEAGRIVNVSSFAYKWGKLDFDNLQQEKNYSKDKAYPDSKLMNILFTKELIKRFQEEGESKIKVVTLHPGTVRTDIFKMD